MAKGKGRGIPANPVGRQPKPARGARAQIGGKPVSPAVARSRKGPAAAQGHGASGK